MIDCLAIPRAPSATFDTAAARPDRVLAVLASSRLPLSMRMLQNRTGIPMAELERVMVGLQTAGHVRRLNTVIESYRLRRLEPATPESVMMSEMMRPGL